MIDEKELNAYYEQISKGLDRVESRTNRDRIINNLKQSVNNYLLSEPKAKMKDVYTNIGFPNEIIFANTVHMPITVLDRLKSRGGKMVLWALAVLIIMFAVFLGINFADGKINDARREATRTTESKSYTIIDGVTQWYKN